MRKEAIYYLKMAKGLAEVFRRPSHSDPLGVIQEQLQHREERFLAQARRYIFSDPSHPYHAMFELAQCTQGDLESLVARRGLEGALLELKNAGIFLTHDEVKRKRPIVRAGREIPSDERSFLKKDLKGSWQSRSSGSRSAGTHTPHSVAYRSYRDCYEGLMATEHGYAGKEFVMLMPILPAPYGLTRPSTMHRMGGRVNKWFAVGGNLRGTAHYRIITKLLVAESRLLGVQTPWPEYLPPHDFNPAVNHLQKTSEGGRKAVVWGVTSPAVRVAAAARDRGIRLDGVSFFVSGEALTEAKRQVIQSTGAEVYPTYIISEIGTIGYACRPMQSGNCVHLFEDNVAVISVERPAPLTQATVHSLHFTTLLPSNPRMLINAEMDDHGFVERTTCDCTLARAGFRRQIRDIWSFSKLTGYGTTLVGSDVLAILEERLPARFGGSPTDYQLVEHDTGLQTNLILRVSPRVRGTDLADVREFFLGQIRAMYGGSLTVRDWVHGDAFQVVSAEPEENSIGKILPLHLLGSGERPAKAVAHSTS
jgi:hypothetical protein